MHLELIRAGCIVDTELVNQIFELDLMRGFAIVFKLPVDAARHVKGGGAALVIPDSCIWIK
jgi:hypothetical protein